MIQGLILSRFDFCLHFKNKLLLFEQISAKGFFKIFVLLKISRYRSDLGFDAILVAESSLKSKIAPISRGATKEAR